MPVVSNEGKKTASGATLTPSRKFAVRLSVATGATLATLIGAQTLALTDLPKTASIVTPVATSVLVTTVPPPNAAPQVIIVRNSVPVAPTAVAPRRVVPPPPVENPAPVEVMPAPSQPEPPSRSSR